MGAPGKWKKCEHDFPIAHPLRYPNRVKYGTLMVCIRCRARRMEIEGKVSILPPIPRDFKPSPHVQRLLGKD